MIMFMGYRNLGSSLLVNWMVVFRSTQYLIPRIYDNRPVRPRDIPFTVRHLCLLRGLTPNLETGTDVGRAS